MPRAVEADPQVVSGGTAQLKRVEYQLPTAGETWTWGQVAARVQAERQMLVIVNTRRDAEQLINTLAPGEAIDEEGDPTLFHLSTRLCGAHRREVLEEVRRRLARVAAPGHHAKNKSHRQRNPHCIPKTHLPILLGNIASSYPLRGRGTIV